MRLLSHDHTTLSAVMRGRVPRIHAFLPLTNQDVDARNKCGHLAEESAVLRHTTPSARIASATRMKPAMLAPST